jgi:hypothetical protein
MTGIVARQRWVGICGVMCGSVGFGQVHESGVGRRKSGSVDVEATQIVIEVDV